MWTTETWGNRDLWKRRQLLQSSRWLTGRRMSSVNKGRKSLVWVGLSSGSESLSSAVPSSGCELLRDSGLHQPSAGRAGTYCCGRARRGRVSLSAPPVLVQMAGSYLKPARVIGWDELTGSRHVSVNSWQQLFHHTRRPDLVAMDTVFFAENKVQHEILWLQLSGSKQSVDCVCVWAKGRRLFVCVRVCVTERLDK